MLGTPRCKAKDWSGSVGVTVLTGTDKDKAVCDINIRKDINHFVLLKNLLAYETRITCRGEIAANPRFIQFESSGSNDTEEQWVGECVLDDNEEHTFSHARVTSKQPGKGEQIIKVTLEIDRLRQRSVKESASLQITVSS